MRLAAACLDRASACLVSACTYLAVGLAEFAVLGGVRRAVTFVTAFSAEPASVWDVWDRQSQCTRFRLTESAALKDFGTEQRSLEERQHVPHAFFLFPESIRSYRGEKCNESNVEGCTNHAYVIPLPICRRSHLAGAVGALGIHGFLACVGSQGFGCGSGRQRRATTALATQVEETGATTQ